MRERRPTIVLAGVLSVMATLTCAQTTPPPAPGAAATPRSPQAQSAIKLAGLVTFVANSCPALRPDYARFDAALAALGVAKADLERPDMRGAYLAYAARYNEDVKTSCQRAAAQFGPHGTTLADIFGPH